MNILNTFEDRVSAIFDTTSQGFRAPFSFKRLAKQAVREMDKETFVVNGVDTAPGLFTILVSPVDDVAIRPFYTKLTTEIRQLVEAQAEKKHAVFVGEPLVRFMVDPSLRSGKFSVFAENVDARTLKRLRAEEASYIDGIGGSRRGNKRAQKRPAPAQGGPVPQNQQGPMSQPAAPSQAQPPRRRRQRPEMPANNRAPEAAMPPAAQDNQAQSMGPVAVAPTMRRPQPLQAQQPQAMRSPQTSGPVSVQSDPDASGFISLPSGAADAPVLASGAMAPLPAAGGTKFGDYTPRSRQKGSMAEQFSGLFGRRAMQLPDPKGPPEQPVPVPQPAPDLQPIQNTGLDLIPEEPRADDGGAMLKASEEQHADASSSPYAQEKPEPADPLSAVARKRAYDEGMGEPYDLEGNVVDNHVRVSPVTGFESNFTPHCMLIDRQSGRTYTAAAPSATIGRERSAADIVMTDPNISRRHAQLEWDGNLWHIVDLNSTNGTLVNNVDVSDSALRDGDVVTLGLINLEFREVM